MKYFKLHKDNSMIIFQLYIYTYDPNIKITIIQTYACTSNVHSNGRTWTSYIAHQDEQKCNETCDVNDIKLRRNLKMRV